MIKAVLFDFGGVLTEGGKAGAIQKILSRIYGIDVANSQLNPLRETLLRGKMSDDEFFAALNLYHAGSAQATKELFNQYADIFIRADSVYALAISLRGHGIKTGILSNIFPMSADKLRKEGFYDGFDPLLLSCEVGLAKPDLAFYQMAIDTLNVPAKEILFIDDQEKCIIPARELGMFTILAVSPAQIVTDVATLIKQQNNQLLLSIR